MGWESFTLQFEMSRGARPVKVVRSAAGQGRDEFGLSFAEIEALLARGVAWGGRPAPSHHEVATPLTSAPGAPEQVGAVLHRALFSGRPGELWNRALGMAGARQNGVRLELVLALDEPQLAKLARLPWELLYDERERSFLFRGTRSLLLTRSFEVGRRVPPLAVRLPLRVLIALAAPAGLPALDVEGEWGRIERVWAGRADVALTCLRHATLEGLRQELLARRHHVVHYVGHGGWEPSSGEGALAFEDARGARRFAAGPVLAEHLGDLKVRLVVLNACHTASLPDAPGAGPFGGVATALVARGLPAVVAMQRPISDRSALLWSDVFYRRLAADDPVDVALAEARLALSTGGKRELDWATPVLYLRSRGARLFAVRPSAADRPAQPPAPASALAPSAATRPAADPPPPAHVWGVPPIPELFLGRAGALRDFKQVLGVAQRTPRRTAAISGAPGLGKTTFVAVLARDPEIAAAFPDGILWMSLGQEPQLLSQLVRWGDWLGDPNLARAATLDDCLARLACLLAPRRVLLLVDDVWNQEDAAGFHRLVQAESSLVVTTRLPLVAAGLAPLPDSHYRLPKLTEDDGLELLAALAPEAVGAHGEECRELVNSLEALPLALHVAGRMLRAESELHLNVRQLIAEIRGGAALLPQPPPADAAANAGTPIRTVSALLNLSTRLLSEELRDRFAALSVMAPKPATFDVAVLKSLWETEDPRPALRELAGRGLLEPLQSGRYQMHALLIAHAQSLLR